MKNKLSKLSPILGAGAIGACPLCWTGSAALLTYLGLGSLIPYWRGLAFAFLILGGIGFAFDFQAHRSPYPLLILSAGGVLLYLGRYVYGGPGFGGWPIWGLGGILVLIAVFYNRAIFKHPGRLPGHQHASR